MWFCGKVTFTESLKDKYGLYLEAYSQRMIQIGSVDDPEYSQHLLAFIEYEANQDVFAKCKEEYAKVDDIMSDMAQAYRYYLYYFPEIKIEPVKI